jgi:hypothetical protein
VVVVIRRISSSFTSSYFAAFVDDWDLIEVKHIDI